MARLPFVVLNRPFTAWKAARAPIVARLDAARERLAHNIQTAALDGFVGTDEVMRRWEAGQRRAGVTAVLNRAAALELMIEL
ncbi:MAG: hypothetical protein ABR608_00975 [Pseudonocardiaceae bacterium]